MKGGTEGLLFTLWSIIPHPKTSIRSRHTLPLMVYPRLRTSMRQRFTPMLLGFRVRHSLYSFPWRTICRTLTWECFTESWTALSTKPRRCKVVIIHSSPFCLPRYFLKIFHFYLLCMNHKARNVYVIIVVRNYLKTMSYLHPTQTYSSWPCNPPQWKKYI